jgi:putative methanogenesis marker protein 8
VSEHVLEVAKARVEIKNGQVNVLTDPLIKHCPLRNDLYGCKFENRQTVERVLKEHIRQLKMYDSSKILELYQKPVSFGASEIIMDGMTEGLVDAAVVVCEGAGTVVVSKPEVLQALGAHMTGLISTTPIREIQEGLDDRGCLILDQACSIDQIRGFELAAKAGFKKIAVTIAGNRAFEAESLRELGIKQGIAPMLFGVHTTGISEAEANQLGEQCDIVWACASKYVREIVGKRSKLQIGVSIPVFALTDQGRRLVLNRVLHFQDGLVIHRACLPLVPRDKQPEPLI